MSSSGLTVPVFFEETPKERGVFPPSKAAWLSAPSRHPQAGFACSLDRVEDPMPCQSLAVEVASIGHDIEVVHPQGGLRLFRHARELRAVVAHVDHVMDHDQVML